MQHSDSAAVVCASYKGQMTGEFFCVLQLVTALLLVASPDSLPACLQLRLIFACNSPEDLLMKKELDAFAAGYYGKFKVHLVL